MEWTDEGQTVPKIITGEQNLVVQGCSEDCRKMEAAKPEMKRQKTMPETGEKPEWKQFSQKASVGW